MPDITINGRTVNFSSTRQVFPDELKAAKQQINRDGQDNLIYRQGRDTFVASSARNVNLLNVEAAQFLSGGSPARVGQTPVRILAVSDELLSPQQRAVRMAEQFNTEKRIPLAEQSYRRAIALATTVGEALDVAASADDRFYIRVPDEAYAKAISLVRTIEEARAVAAHAQRNGFTRRATQANQKAVSLL
ncbi:MAG: hypothetical protein VKP62_06935 [Candidatus Sericytochromatia bacterium]|nr:hypothetical protein [Candidatus Sericytochromatia bacterium]